MILFQLEITELDLIHHSISLNAKGLFLNNGTFLKVCNSTDSILLNGFKCTLLFSILKFFFRFISSDDVCHCWLHGHICSILQNVLIIYARLIFFNSIKIHQISIVQKLEPNTCTLSHASNVKQNLGQTS